MFPSGCRYPYELPVFGFRDANVPPEVLLNITKKVANHVQQAIGSPIIYDMVTYAQELAEMSVVGDKGSLSKLVSHDASTASSDKVLLDKVCAGLERLDNAKLLSNSEADSKCKVARLDEDTKLTKVQASSQVQSTAHQSSNATPRRQTSNSLALESSRLKFQWEQLLNSSKYADMLRNRSKLPAFKQRSLLLTSVRKNIVTVICGTTGCGKSTQVRNYSFNSQCHSLCK